MQISYISEDRFWLHYGMIMLAYPFFFEGAATIGRLSRYGHPISTSMVRKQLIAEMGTTWFFAGGG